MEELGTDKYIASAVSESVDRRAIPVLVFILSAAIALATGTSWGTSTIPSATYISMCCSGLSAHRYYATLVRSALPCTQPSQMSAIF
jgi:Na+/H+ antiporter NhaC